MFIKLKNYITQTFLIFFIAIALFLICDFLFGSFILKKMEKQILTTEFYDRLVRVKHPVYHHALKPNKKILKARGLEGTYILCTDNHGFKSKCDQIRGKKFEYGFLGDSFTEGIAEYESSYAGLFENYSQKTLANLGVTSYSPKIYLSKLNYLLSAGYQFEHVVVFVDISDLYDDSFFYHLDEKLIVTDKKKINKKLSKKIVNFYKEYTPFNRDNFPLSNFMFFVIKQSNLLNKNKLKFEKINTEFSFLKKVNLKAKWTYSTDLIYGNNISIKDSQEEMIKNMNHVYEILKKKKITLSLVVYPWPHQLIFDTRKSKHVEMWRDFCHKKCVNFINTFDIFFDEVEKTSLNAVIKKYYIKNDPHFNRAGHKLIFEQLVKYLK